MPPFRFPPSPTFSDSSAFAGRQHNSRLRSGQSAEGNERRGTLIQENIMAETVTQLRRRETWTKGGPVVSTLEGSEIAAIEDRAAAAIADPAPLGLWAFATGTWILGTVIGGAFPESTTKAAAPVLLIFAGLAQFIAGLFAFRRTNVLAATAFTCFGSFNVTAAVIFGLQAGKVLGTNGNDVVLEGFLLESFAFIAFALMVAAARMNLALVAVLGTLGVGYALSGIPDLVNSVNGSGWAILRDIGGWFLVASALFAYYAGMALVVNSIWSQTVLPLGGEP
jgi:succinate-acetate transporter protein